MLAKQKSKDTAQNLSAGPYTETAPGPSAVPAQGPHPAGIRFVPGFRFRLPDLFVLILILALAGTLYYGISLTAAGSTSETARLEAVLTVSGEEVWRADISDGAQPVSYQVTGIDGHLTVRAEAGRACISYSDCQDQVCVLTGWLTAPGQSAVCLPNRCVLKIESVAGSTGTAASETAAYDIVSK